MGGSGPDQGRVQDFILGVAKGGQEQNEGWQLGLSPGAIICWGVCKISVVTPSAPSPPCAIVTSAGKMSVNAHSLILSYRQKKWKMSVLVEFEVFTKMSSLSLLLAIPILQIVIKHLICSLFVRFLRGVAYLFSAHFWTTAASQHKL